MITYNYIKEISGGYNREKRNIRLENERGSNNCSVVMMLAGNSVAAFGNPVTSAAIHLPENQQMVAACIGYRTGSYSYVKFRCMSVFPPSGADNYKKIQFRVFCGTFLNSWTVATEGAVYTKIYLKEEYLNSKTVSFQLRGNSSVEAYTVVQYDCL